MADECYKIPKEPVYDPNIRALQDSDWGSASQTFNPLFLRLIENTAAVKNELAALAESTDEKFNGTFNQTVQAILPRQLNITIPTAGWKSGAESELPGYSYVDIIVKGITDKMIPYLSIDPSGMSTAKACGFSTTTMTNNGSLRVYAKEAPANEIQASLTLLCTSAGNADGDIPAGGVYILPAATASRLGGVKVGSGLSVAPDGTLSVNTEKVMTDEDIVDEAEVLKAVTDILNKD